MRCRSRSMSLPSGPGAREKCRVNWQAHRARAYETCSTSSPTICRNVALGVSFLLSRKGIAISPENDPRWDPAAALLKTVQWLLVALRTPVSLTSPPHLPTLSLPLIIHIPVPSHLHIVLQISERPSRTTPTSLPASGYYRTLFLPFLAQTAACLYIF